MALTTTDQVRVVRSAVYDGLNGMEIVTTAQLDFVSDDGNILRFTVPDQPFPVYEVEVGERVFWSGGGAFDGNSVELLPFPWRELPTGVDQRFVTVTGTAEVQGSLLGETQVINVTLSPVEGGDGFGMDGTMYTPMVSLRGAPGVLTGHGIDEVTVLDADTVQVTVMSDVGSFDGARLWAVAHQLQTV